MFCFVFFLVFKVLPKTVCHDLRASYLDKIILSTTISTAGLYNSAWMLAFCICFVSHVALRLRVITRRLCLGSALPTEIDIALSSRHETLSLFHRAQNFSLHVLSWCLLIGRTVQSLEAEKSGLNRRDRIHCLFNQWWTFSHFNTTLTFVNVSAYHGLTRNVFVNEIIFVAWRESSVIDEMNQVKWSIVITGKISCINGINWYLVNMSWCLLVIMWKRILNEKCFLLSQKYI